MQRLPLAIAAALVFVAATASAQAPDAKELYVEHCKKCHGALGTPPQTMKMRYKKIPTFNAGFVAKISEDSIVKVLTKGKSEDMISFKLRLSPAEITAVARYVRELAARPQGRGWND